MKKRITCWTVLVVSLATALCWAAGPVSPDQIENVRTVTEKWVQTQGLISKERQDWTLGREMLQERISLVESEIASLREKIDEAQTSITDAETKRAELVEENEKLKEAGLALEDIVTSLEARTAALNKQLPDPIAERIKPLTQRLPEDPNKTELSLSQRFPNVLGILLEVAKFNRGIEVTSEVRTLADGSVAEVTAVYVGLGQAYYTGANGKVAGLGHRGPNGWVWVQANDVAADVADTVAILKNEKVAGFIPLPVTIQQGTANAK